MFGVEQLFGLCPPFDLCHTARKLGQRSTSILLLDSAGLVMLLGPFVGALWAPNGLSGRMLQGVRWRCYGFCISVLLYFCLFAFLCFRVFVFLCFCIFVFLYLLAISVHFRFDCVHASSPRLGWKSNSIILYLSVTTISSVWCDSSPAFPSINDTTRSGQQAEGCKTAGRQ